MKFNLGDKVRDIVTGFKGVATAVTIWLNGCCRYGVQGTQLKDGRPTELVWIDEEQLELVSAKAISVKKREKDTGGPRPVAPSRDPQR